MTDTAKPLSAEEIERTRRIATTLMFPDETFVNQQIGLRVACLLATIEERDRELGDLSHSAQATRLALEFKLHEAEKRITRLERIEAAAREAKKQLEEMRPSIMPEAIPWLTEIISVLSCALEGR